MSNIIDFLLSTNIDEIERPSKEVEIPRLSKLMGGENKFILTCKALYPSKYERIQEQCLKIDSNGGVDLDLDKMQYEMLLNGVFADDGTRFFSNQELHKAFKVSSSKEFMKKILLSGESEKLSKIIQDLMGFDKDSVVEIKN